MGKSGEREEEAGVPAERRERRDKRMARRLERWR